MCLSVRGDAMTEDRSRRRVPLYLCCAEDDEVALIQVIEELHREGFAPEVVSGLESDPSSLALAVDQAKDEGLFVFCMTDELDRTAVRRLEGLFSARRGPHQRSTTVLLQAQQPLSMLPIIRRSMQAILDDRGPAPVPASTPALTRDVVEPIEVSPPWDPQGGRGGARRLHRDVVPSSDALERKKARAAAHPKPQSLRSGRVPMARGPIRAPRDLPPVDEDDPAVRGSVTRSVAQPEASGSFESSAATERMRRASVVPRPLTTHVARTAGSRWVLVAALAGLGGIAALATLGLKSSDHRWRAPAVVAEAVRPDAPAKLDASVASAPPGRSVEPRAKTPRSDPKPGDAVEASLREIAPAGVVAAPAASPATVETAAGSAAGRDAGSAAGRDAGSAAGRADGPAAAGRARGVPIAPIAPIEAVGTSTRRSAAAKTNDTMQAPSRPPGRPEPQDEASRAGSAGGAVRAPSDVQAVPSPGATNPEGTPKTVPSGESDVAAPAPSPSPDPGAAEPPSALEQAQAEGRIFRVERSWVTVPSPRTVDWEGAQRYCKDLPPLGERRFRVASAAQLVAAKGDLPAGTYWTRDPADREDEAMTFDQTTSRAVPRDRLRASARVVCAKLDGDATPDAHHSSTTSASR